MENSKNQILDKLHESMNVLVTVSKNPSVDQLAACIGLTILLNKMGKHATAVFSGQVPSTIDFLKPDETLEKTTDSLRDFIISLDKSKADKLRYKVEDQLVKIFITPYRTSIGADDLEFSQGDFNVDLVLGLGVKQRDELDEAITGHGRILHDATVACINNSPGSELGSINWIETSASSLCEMLTSVVDELKEGALDGQMSTALLTGIVAETDRFSNAKTTSLTMSLSSKLMTAGANQQLVASELQRPQPEPAAAPAPEVDNQPVMDSPPPTDGVVTDNQTFDNESHEPPAEAGDGALKIDHPSNQPPLDGSPSLNVDEQGIIVPPEPFHDFGDDQVLPKLSPDNDSEEAAGRMMDAEPPTMGGVLNSAGNPNALDPSTDPLSQLPNTAPMLNRSLLPPPKPQNQAAIRPAPPKNIEPPKPTPPLPPLPPVVSTPPEPPKPPTPPTPPPEPPKPPTPPTPPAPKPTLPLGIDPNAPILPAGAPPSKPYNIPNFGKVDADDTLTSIENMVHSPHLIQQTPPPATPTAVPLPLQPPVAVPAKPVNKVELPTNPKVTFQSTTVPNFAPTPAPIILPEMVLGDSDVTNTVPDSDLPNINIDANTGELSKVTAQAAPQVVNHNPPPAVPPPMMPPTS